MLLTRNAVLLGLILALATVVVPISNAVIGVHRTALAPDRLQGRVNAASIVISMSTGWLGPLGVGVLIAGIGETATILTLTGFGLILAAIATAAGSFRRPPVIEAVAELAVA
jgi:hypothetical protein